MKMRCKKDKTPNWYLALVIFYAFLGLVDSILLLYTTALIDYFVVIGVSWLIFSVWALIYFSKRYECKSLILPVYYLVFFFSSFTLVSLLNNFYLLVGLQFFSSAFEMLFAIFLLKREF
jgi:hypothetical protein